MGGCEAWERNEGLERPSRKVTESGILCILPKLAAPVIVYFSFEEDLCEASDIIPLFFCFLDRSE